MKSTTTPWLAGGLALAALFAMAEPFWETNDDVAMAMIILGYGISAAPDPGTVFQNILYARLVQALPEWLGLQKYGVASYALLLAAGLSCGVALHRAGAPAVLAAAAIFAVFAPTLVYPQFTLLAGLLAVAGLLVLVAPGAHLSIAECVLGCLLLILGALVRLDEVLLVGAVVAPYVVVAAGGGRVRRFAALAFAAVIISAAAFVNRAHYAGDEWRDFHAVNKHRVWFTDYGYARYFMRYPLDAVIAGFTFNDLRLLHSFFFADPRVFSPQRFDRATRYMNPLLWMLSNLSPAGELTRPFTHPHSLALLALLALLAWRLRGRQLYWAIGLVGIAMLLAGLVGRAGLTRILIPPIAGIVLLSLAGWRTAWVPPRWLQGSAVAIAVALAIALGIQNADDRTEARKLRAVFCALPADRLYIVWGHTVPFERVYAPFGHLAMQCPLQFYGVGVYSYAPFALERLRRATDSGDLVAALLQGRELDFLAQGAVVEQGLEIYLRQHYGAKVVTRRLADYGSFGWYRATTVSR